LISQTGISGSRIPLGQATTAPFPAGLPLVAFDGTNYLVVWMKKITSPNYEVYGQFIDTSGKDVSSGVYFCQLKTPTGILEIRKMLLLR